MLGERILDEKRTARSGGATLKKGRRKKKKAA
jgi:hypothetical protein